MTQTYKEREPLGLDELLDADLFRALSDPNRLNLLVRLCESEGPSTVTDTADCCPVDLSVVSRHLSVMRHAGVVDAEKQGREVRYRVPHAELAETLRSIADAIDACCSPADGCDPAAGTAPDEKEISND